MTNVFQKAAMQCDKHGKRSYTTRDLARQASREMHEPGMREYRCDAYEGYWHIGHLPEAVRNGEKTADEHYGRVQPLTYRPGPDNIKPLNGSKPPAATIESLLVAAESSGVTEAEKLAKQIREMLIRLVDEMRIGQQRRTIEAEIAAREAQIAKLEEERDKAVAALRELCGEPEPKPFRPVDNLPPTADQGLIRAWARENGIPVKVHGVISLKVREAYEKAMGGK